MHSKGAGEGCATRTHIDPRTHIRCPCLWGAHAPAPREPWAVRQRRRRQGDDHSGFFERGDRQGTSPPTPPSLGGRCRKAWDREATSRAIAAVVSERLAAWAGAASGMCGRGRPGAGVNVGAGAGAGATAGAGVGAAVCVCTLRSRYACEGGFEVGRGGRAAAAGAASGEAKGR